MRPIPKRLLIHTATLHKIQNEDRWGNGTLDEGTELSYVRLEPSSKVVRDKNNAEIQLAAVLFYDCRNSRPKDQEFSEDDMIRFASRLQRLNENWGYTLATCGERIDIEKYGIIHNKCVDDDLMIKYFYDDAKLMEFLGVEVQDVDLFTGIKTIIKKKNNKDKGQRQFCGCIVSKDIGEYNTCAHLCEYCYANSSKESALRNLQMHRRNPFAETIKGI